MSFSPFTLAYPSYFAPLVISSPHSGRLYPADFDYACPLPLLRTAEDAFVDELIVDAPSAGATLITAEFPRSYIDLNRAEDDIDPQVLSEAWPLPLNPGERTLKGLGLVRRLCASGVPVYRAPLPNAVIAQRLSHCYRPYHAALAQVLDERQRQFGAAYLLDIHSMPSSGTAGRDKPRPDFVLGDRDSASCAAAFTAQVQVLLQRMGYSVAVNDPYKGQEILRRHADPAAGRHGLQIEINRRLYMNETTLETTGGFTQLKRDLTALFHDLADSFASEARLAAE